MSSEVIQVRKALSVFYKVMEYGTKRAEGVEFDGVIATGDFDGYTVTLLHNEVRLSIFFHNKFKCDYPNRQALDRFMLKLDKIDQMS